MSDVQAIALALSIAACIASAVSMLFAVESWHRSGRVDGRIDGRIDELSERVTRTAHDIQRLSWKVEDGERQCFEFGPKTIEAMRKWEDRIDGRD